jgi:hypothetical protein
MVNKVFYPGSQKTPPHEAQDECEHLFRRDATGLACSSKNISRDDPGECEKIVEENFLTCYPEKF